MNDNSIVYVNGMQSPENIRKEVKEIFKKLGGESCKIFNLMYSLKENPKA